MSQSGSTKGFLEQIYPLRRILFSIFCLACFLFIFPEICQSQSALPPDFVSPDMGKDVTERVNKTLENYEKNVDKLESGLIVDASRPGFQSLVIPWFS